MPASPSSDGSLDPSPEAIVRLVERIVRERWPTGCSRFDDYFGRLGCLPGAPAEPENRAPAGMTRGALLVPGTAVKDASWAALDDELFAVNFFAYEGSADLSAADVDAGFEAIRGGLSAAFGPSPDERTDERGNRSAVWRPRESVVELYGHVNEGAVVQVGVAHEGRATAYEHLIARASGRPDHEQLEHGLTGDD